MPAGTKSGIQTSSDGTSYIPSSTRADGSTRKEIKVRPGYKPPEDVETYKSRNAEAWRNRGPPGIPGADVGEIAIEATAESKSKNAKRREAARRKKEAEGVSNDVSTDMKKLELDHAAGPGQDSTTATTGEEEEAEAERQKKIRNQLKKLRAVRDLKAKKAAGEKLSSEQIVKIGKEDELLRDLKKLDYDGTELTREDQSSID